MKEKNEAAVALGRLGGKSTSPAKVKASRRNGRKLADVLKKLHSLQARYDLLRSLARDAVQLAGGDQAQAALDALAEELRK